MLYEKKKGRIHQKLVVHGITYKVVKRQAFVI